MWRDKRELTANDDNRDVEDFTIPELKQILADGLRREAIADKKKEH